MRVGLDLDGVTANFHQRYIDEINDRHDSHLTLNDWKVWDLTNVPWITPEEFNETIKYVNESGAFRHLEPIRGALRGIERLRREGHSIHVITYRTFQARADTVPWLDYHGVDFETLSFSKEKGELCRSLSIDYMVDDVQGICEDVIKNGSKAILFDRPWNSDYVLKDGIYRAKNWTEVGRIINGIETNEDI